MVFPRSLAVIGANALLVLASSASCEVTSGSGARSATTSCQSRDCEVTVSGAQGTGDLWEQGNTTIGYRILLADDQEADVRVSVQERAYRESEEAVLVPGDSAEVGGYTVTYVEHTGDAATFDFTWQD
ncbi:hypothetical protein [Nocardiopsis tropica]|uniref:Uncharacterized protein n=1 Tax=Nocardiopsis tropica TaxID=109330 RepID=A0ABU7L2P8_9ACTN|nr:hypothetical protein [Nocardiopsis umidischolae]MEE2055840.1 hypothetical protein [Nocardiopsis umidischolae]